jgi:hypothetical protein
LVIGAACGNWSLDQKIGEGGYGEVFRGEWEHQAVAIKRIRYSMPVLPVQDHLFWLIFM